jgi:hypothetical protein
MQATAATTEIQAREPRELDLRASAALTPAKMMRKPALPIVEILARSSTLASARVAAAVMSSEWDGRRSDLAA